MHDAIKLLKDNAKKVVLAITGGGTEAIIALLEHGGASSVLLDAQVPYSKEALDKYLGRSPDKYCSKETACTMSAMAWHNAIKLGADVDDAVGLGACCSLIRDGIETPEVYSDGTRRLHRAYIAVHTKEKTTTYEVQLNELNQDRRDQEQKIGTCIVTALELLIEKQSNPFWYLDETDTVDVGNYSLQSIVGENTSLPNEGFFGFRIAGESGTIVFPGSFNPFHAGHKAIAEYIHKKYGEKICFEISLTNRDKPPVDYFSLYNRVRSIPQDEEFFGEILITNTPFFDDKIKILPNSKFIVGVDTWNRILLDGSQVTNCDNLRLIVIPRKGIEIADWLPFPRVNPHSFVVENELEIPSISSTQIRRLE